MGKMERAFDPAAIAAEENLVIDFQFLLQELMTKHDLNGVMLAERAGITPARLSQLMSSEANPTAKSLARLFYALGEEVTAVRKADVALIERAKNSERRWDHSNDDSGRPISEANRALLLQVVRETNVVRLDASNRANLIAA